jgi:hypothetical protein
MILNSTLSLTSETPLLKEELKRAKTVLQMLYDSNDSAEFREAVDWESIYRITLALGLNDYPQLIKFPMNLGTVSSKLQAENYHFVEEMLDDIQLIWDNCKAYNKSGSVHLSYLSGSIPQLTRCRSISRNSSKITSPLWLFPKL